MSAFRAIGQEFNVNQHTTSNQAAPNIAANPATGGFQIVWQSFGQDGNRWGVFGQNFDSQGNAVGAEISIADMTVGDQITGVGGRDYSAEMLKAAVASTSQGDKVELLVKRGKRYRETTLSYTGGLRYPALRKTGQGETGLDRLLAPQTR